MTNKELEVEVNKIKEGQNSLLDTIKEEFKKINDEISNLKKFHSNPILERPVTKEVQKDPNSTSSFIASGTFPVPPEYQDIVKYALNSNFKATIDYKTEGMEFTIIVPQKYSTLTPEQVKVIGGDLRTKIIPQHEGANGVRLWAEKVYGSFPAETKSMIQTDRINN